MLVAILVLGQHTIEKMAAALCLQIAKQKGTYTATIQKIYATLCNNADCHDYDQQKTEKRQQFILLHSYDIHKKNILYVAIC